MKKIIYILFLVLVTNSGAATAWLNTNSQDIVFIKPTQFIVDGVITYIDFPTDEQLNQYGWIDIEAPDVDINNMYIDYQLPAIYEIFTEPTNVIINIDAQTQQIATQFATIMTNYFGVDCLTNRTVTQTYVASFFTAKVVDMTITTLELAHASMLEHLFNVLQSSPYNPTPETTWDFPFGQTAVTNIVNKRYYIVDGNKVYLE